MDNGYMKEVKFTKQETGTIEFIINNELKLTHYHGTLFDPLKRHKYKVILKNILRKIERL